MMEENNYNIKGMDKDQLKKEIDKRTLEVIQTYMRGQGFIGRKLTDTPTDDLMIVNRKFVTLNGLVANRPTSSVATVGQSYFATDTNIPMTYSLTGWRNGIGSIVAGI